MEGRLAAEDAVDGVDKVLGARVLQEVAPRAGPGVCCETTLFPSCAGERRHGDRCCAVRNGFSDLDPKTGPEGYEPGQNQPRGRGRERDQL
jgi:hypothetical protein